MRFTTSNQSTLDQRGAVAIITVVLLVIILSILTLGFLRLSVNEQRQSIDDDLSARAYYAAEAGVADAQVKLRQAALGYIAEVRDGYAGNFESYLNENYSANTCQSDTLSPEDDLNTGYTCLKMDPADDFNAAIGEDEVQVVILPGQADGVELSWHKTPELGAGAPQNDGMFDVAPGGQLVLWRKQEWVNRMQPALLRATFFYREGGSFRTKTALFYPKSGTWPRANFASADFDGGIFPSPCDKGVMESAPGEFACYHDIRNLPTGTDIIAVAISMRYRDAQIKVTATRQTPGGPAGSRQTVAMDRGQVIADVTGRAGDVFRRVEAVLDLNSVFFKELLNIPDETIDEYLDSEDAEYIMISGRSLCKTFSVTNSGNSFNNNQNNWCDRSD